MNFIPGGHVVPASVQDAHAEAESQLLISAPADIDTQLPSPNMDIELDEDDQDDDETSTPRVDVIPISPDRCAMPPPQLQTPSASNPAKLYSQKSESLQVNIQDPLSEELIRRVTEAFYTLLPSLWGASPLQKKGPASPSVPMLKDLPQEELLRPRERRMKKQDKRPRKKP